MKSFGRVVLFCGALSCSLTALLRADDTVPKKLVSLDSPGPAKGTTAGAFAAGKAAVTSAGPAFEQWIQDVAALSPDQKLVEVIGKLRQLNPGFDGLVGGGMGSNRPKIVKGVVTEFTVWTDGISDISPVRAMAGLKVLVCAGSRLGCGILSDLSPLRGMSLTRLDCGNSRVVDLSPLSSVVSQSAAGQAPLPGLPELTNLGLAGTAITDSDLVHLQGLTHLKSLSLKQTGVTDAGLVYLKGMTQLRALELDETAVTNAGLVHLHGLTHLKMLTFHNTKVTDAGALALKKALPNCYIHN